MNKNQSTITKVIFLAVALGLVLTSCGEVEVLEPVIPTTIDSTNIPTPVDTVLYY